MTFNIALNFEDGITRFIQCHAGEKVLDAAYRQKVNLPMDCSDGVCGTCKCHCASGEYDLGEDYLDEALSDDEAQNRQVQPASGARMENTHQRPDPGADHKANLEADNVNQPAAKGLENGIGDLEGADDPGVLLGGDPEALF